MDTNEHEWLKSGSSGFVSIRVHSWFAILLLFLLPFRDLWAGDLGAISGRVLGPDGNGVALVPVSAINMESKETTRGESALDGTYVMRQVASGFYVVQASGDDQNYLAKKKVRVEAGSETKDVDLVSGGLVLTGVVKEAGGGAIPGAFITAEKTDFREGEFLPKASARTAHTDAEGRYRIEGLLPGLYRITMAGPGLGIRLFTNFTMAADAGLDVVFEGGSFIAGRVVGPGGEIREDAQVQAFRVDGSPVIRCFAAADKDGRFQVGNLGRGRYELIVLAHGHQALVKPGVEVAAGTTNELGDVALAAGGGAVTGRVTYGPLPLQAIVVLKSTFSCLEYMTQADDAGVYTFENVPAGDYVIHFSDPTSEPVQVEVSDGGSVVVDHSFYSAE